MPSNACSTPSSSVDVLVKEQQKILVIDFGSQVSHLICRRCREAGVFCELRSCLLSAADVRAFAPVGIILSGGPHSVYDEGAPHLNAEVWALAKELDLPILGICYGLQEMCRFFGGEVVPGDKREFGSADLDIRQHALPTDAGSESPPMKQARRSPSLFHEIDISVAVQVWMSHGDKVTKLPDGFAVVGSTASCEYAAVEHRERRMFGVQFHPEVTHTPCGGRIIQNFVRGVCGCRGEWSMRDFTKLQVTTITNEFEGRYVIGAVSGGVDSSVAAALAHRAIGGRFRPFLVDTGLLRKGEAPLVKERLEKHIPGLDLTVIDARTKFFEALRGVTEPEKKRKIIGALFIECFEHAVAGMKLPIEQCVLLQGTLYPDVIESTAFRGPSSTIKTHHNVGGLPDKMKMGVLEPLRLLFKDEVRAMGLELGLPRETVMRHPFPGPGLGIRIMGEVTEENVTKLQMADAIYLEELVSTGHYDKIGQAFAVLLPTVRSVGVMGDHRTYENAVVLRAVTTTDFMTADWYDMPHDVLARISNRISNEVRGVNRVCYDVSSKPPATIEWE